jgi:hypothetical protein
MTIVAAPSTPTSTRIPVWRDGVTSTVGPAWDEPGTARCRSGTRITLRG